MLEQIKLKIQGLELLIEPTLDNRIIFERNCRNGFMANILRKNIDTLERYKSFIGKEIFKYKRSIGHSETKISEYMNQTEDEATLFTEEAFEEFKTKIINYWIKYYSDDLLTREISQSSTNKLSNLQFEWQVEMKQELIKFYNNIAGNNPY